MMIRIVLSVTFVGFVCMLASCKEHKKSSQKVCEQINQNFQCEEEKTEFVKRRNKW